VTPDRPVALVTGASRGIGREVALALAGAGHDIAFTARTRHEGEGTVPPRTAREVAAGTEPLPVPGSLESVAEEIRALGVRALPVPMDLTDLTSVRAAVAHVHDAWGHVGVLVNNAILHVPHARVLELDLAALQASLQANYVHQLALVQAVVPRMLERGGGLIVDLWSGSVVNDPPAPPGEGGWGLAYASSKAAFARIAGALNAEFWHRGVRAFNLDPGFVVTEAATARGGVAAIAAHGVPTVPAAAAGRAVVRLATDPDFATAARGRVVRAADFVRVRES